MGSSKKADFKNQAYERHPFLMSVEETAQQLGTNLETGLTDAKVQELQQRYGRNQLEGDSGIKWYALLGKQISNAMIMVRTFFSYRFFFLRLFWRFWYIHVSVWSAMNAPDILAGELSQLLPSVCHSGLFSCMVYRGS